MSPARPSLLLGLLALLGLACAREAPGTLRRRSLSPPPASGWVRVPLDAAAQREAEGLWISDAHGRSVPFRRVREGLWAPEPLALDQPVLGTDRQGRPVAEFGLRLPEGWQVGDREQLRLELDLQGAPPWVATVAAERARPDGGYLAYAFPAPPHLYDLSPSGRRTDLTLPWDGTRYRLVLHPDQGAAPVLRGVRVFAETRPEALEAEETLEAAFAPEPGRPGGWRLILPREDRVVGLEVDLLPPVAPVRAEVACGEEGPLRPAPEPLWNLPALGSRSTRISLPPALVRTLRLRLPAGATPAAIRALVRHQTLLFPAEAGEAYTLHLGGEPRPAPGDLGALPSSRALLAAAALRLGPETPDPDGLPRRLDAGERLRPWMPWVAGAAVLLLGLAAWRLLRDGAGGGS